MTMKAIVTVFIIANCFASCLSRAALRRTPKVYNALITTDENLTSSRAYPVIQPTIHETGIPHYPFGHYNGYSYYSPSVVRFGQPLAPGLVPQEQLPYPIPNMQFSPQIIQHLPPHLQRHEGFPGYPLEPHPPTASAKDESVAASEIAQQDLEKSEVAPLEQQEPVVPPKDAPNEPQDPKYMPIEDNGPREMPNGKLPILLNAYGLPPSLIPLQQYPVTRTGTIGTHNPSHNTANLPPYAFNQYPLLPGFYDPITGFREQYLPPYDYSAAPHQTYALAAAAAAAAAKKPTAGNVIPPAATPAPPIESQTAEAINPNPDNADSDSETTQSPDDSADSVVLDFESIKNGSKNKNREVPDVPPPPIPSGAKTKSSS